MSELPQPVELPAFVRGATFKLRIQHVDPATGLATDLTGWTIECKIKQRDDTLVAASFDGTLETLVIEIENQTTSRGFFTITCPYASTATWPLDQLYTDVWFTDTSSVRTPSPVLTFPVSKGISR